MLTVKVVTSWAGSQQPPYDSTVRPSTTIHECRSVYEDAGRVHVQGCPDGEGGAYNVQYDPVMYDQPWEQRMYVMNSSGSTISTFLLGYFGGDIGVPCKLDESPWHPSPVELSQPEQNAVAAGVAAA